MVPFTENGYIPIKLIPYYMLISSDKTVFQFNHCFKKEKNNNNKLITPPLLSPPAHLILPPPPLLVSCFNFSLENSSMKVH